MPHIKPRTPHRPRLWESWHIAHEVGVGASFFQRHEFGKSYKYEAVGQQGAQRKVARRGQAAHTHLFTPGWHPGGPEALQMPISSPTAGLNNQDNLNERREMMLFPAKSQWL